MWEPDHRWAIKFYSFMMIGYWPPLITCLTSSVFKSKICYDNQQESHFKFSAMTRNVFNLRKWGKSHNWTRARGADCGTSLAVRNLFICLFFLLSWHFLQLLPSKGWKFWWHWAWWGWQSLKHFCNWGRIQPERHPEGTITCEEATIGDDKKDHTKDVWQWTPDQAQQTDWALQGSRLWY